MHGQDVAESRPGRPIEHLINQSEQAKQMAGNCAARLHDLLGRLHQGNAPAILSSTKTDAPMESLPELPTIERNLAELQRSLESILDATNGLEAL
jgi:hypothetical protein